MTTAPLVICRPRIGVDTGALSYVLRIMVPKVLARNSVIVQKEAHQVESKQLKAARVLGLRIPTQSAARYHRTLRQNRYRGGHAMMDIFAVNTHL